MKTSINKFVNRMATVAIVISTALVTSCNNYDDDIDRLNEKINNLNETINNQSETINNQTTIINNLADKVESVVYVPDFFDGMIGVTNGQEQNLRYQVRPVELATELASNPAALSLIGEDVAVTRGTSAGFSISSAAATADGILQLRVKPEGFEAQKGYAFALNIQAADGSYTSPYTPTFLIVEADEIALGIVGLFAGMGTVTVGSYLQLFVVFFPDYVTSRDVTWTSSDETRATVSPSGIIAVAEDAADGEFTITATTSNGKKASLTFYIVGGNILINTDQLKQVMAQ